MSAVGEKTEFGHAMKAHFLFDSKWTNLNHGSFGTHPAPVRNALRGYQKLTDACPDKFLRYQYVDLLDKSRERVANLVQASVDDCVLVVNATTAIETVLQNLSWQPKDTIIYFDTAYPSVEKGLLSLAERNPQIHLRPVGHGQDFGYKLPATHPEILNAFSQTISRLLYEGYTPKVAIFETVSALPGVRFPFERLTRMCREYGILSLIDGAHGIGQIPLNMRTLDPDFFISNCHKWLYTPRGCALFYVPKRNQHLVRTSIPTSHGYKPLSSQYIKTLLPASNKSDFIGLFQFMGTADNSPLYCIPAALNFRANLCGGEDAIYYYIRDVAQRGADLLATVLGTEVMDDLDPDEGLKTVGSREGSARRSGPDPWVGGLRDCAMANVLLPIKIDGAYRSGSLRLGPGGAGSGGGLPLGLNGGRKFTSGYSSPSPKTSQVEEQLDFFPSPSSSPIDDGTVGPVTVRREDLQLHVDWIQKALVDEYNTHVPVYEYSDRIWTRVSGQIYLELKDFEWLGGVLKGLCERIRMGESLKGQRQASSMASGKDLDLEDIESGTKGVELKLASARNASITQAGWVEN